MSDQNSRTRESAVNLALTATVIFIVLCLETLFSVAYRAVHLATHSAVKAWVAGLAGLLLCFVAHINRHLLCEGALWAMRKLTGAFRQSKYSLVAGLTLRLLWLFRYHQPFTSDGAEYFQGAANLAQGHSYGVPYWPPGFPLFLSTFFAALGAHQWVAWLCSLLLFAATSVMVSRLAERVTGTSSAGAWAGWLLALWPGYIAVSNINSKEMLLACILSSIMLLAYVPVERQGKPQWAKACIIGVLTGCAALTQPGFTLFPAVLFASQWLRGRRFWSAVWQTAIIICFMLLTILPWTARNYRAYHRYILISTNGGSVFYTANNARANASYSEEAQRALPVDTIEADRIGYQLGKQWIREHPLDFAKLAIRKQVVFLGDDGIGIYEVLRRDRSASALLYNSLKGICSLYWFLLWLLLLCCRRVLFRACCWTDWFGIAFLPFVYQWSIDSVFESGSRHHMAYVGCLALIASVALTRVSEPSWETEDPHSYRMMTLM